MIVVDLKQLTSIALTKQNRGFCSPTYQINAGGKPPPTFRRASIWSPLLRKSTRVADLSNSLVLIPMLRIDSQMLGEISLLVFFLDV